MCGGPGFRPPAEAGGLRQHRGQQGITVKVIPPPPNTHIPSPHVCLQWRGTKKGSGKVASLGEESNMYFHPEVSNAENGSWCCAFSLAVCEARL